MTIEKIVVSCVNMNIKHKNLIEKLDLLVCDDFHPNYVSILIITTILITTTTTYIYSKNNAIISYNATYCNNYSTT